MGPPNFRPKPIPNSETLGHKGQLAYLSSEKLRKTYTIFFKFKVLFGALGRPIIGKYVPTVPQTSLLGSLSSLRPTQKPLEKKLYISVRPSSVTNNKSH